MENVLLVLMGIIFIWTISLSQTKLDKPIRTGEEALVIYLCQSKECLRTTNW